MAYQLPKYVSDKQLSDYPIDYTWDDTRVYECLPPLDYGEAICKKMAPLSIRAKNVIAVGIYEWILGRLGIFAKDNVASDFAEAAWCATIDRYYIQYIEYNRNEYLGPIDGALWCAFMSVAPLLYVSNHISDIDDSNRFYQIYDPDAWENEIPFLIALTFHILPNEERKSFKRWLSEVIERFILLFPAPENEPFSNAFGYDDDTQWLGEYIAPEALDLAHGYSKEQTIDLINHFLNTVNRNNPLLFPLNELQKDIKTPFYLAE